VIAKLVQPVAIDLGEGPAVERRSALVAMLLGQHAGERAAEQRDPLVALADKEDREAHESRQHGDEARPHLVVEILCLHGDPPPLG
jgi:hypothetical protein